MAKKKHRIKDSELEWPSKVGVIYSAVRREDFPTESQYITEREAEQNAYVIGEYLGALGLDVCLYPGDEMLSERLRQDQPEMLFNLVDSVKGKESLAAAMKAKDIPVDPNATRGKLIDSLLGDYLEPTLIQPTFIYNYPRDISPLAKSMPGDPSMVERFEGYVGGMELCNAFTELNDPLDQEARFLEMGRDYAADDEERHPMDEDYLRAMRYGMPPNGGFGMGIDRLAMLFTDSPNIREVILFPHLRKEE